MKDHTAITVTNLSGTRHFRIKHSTKRRVLIGLLTVFVVAPTSLSYNYLQHAGFVHLSYRYTHLDTALEKLDKRNAEIDAKIVADHESEKTLGEALADLERVGGMQPSDAEFTVAERIHAISQFYREKENEYSEIDNRIDKIEGVVGLPDKDLLSKVRENLAARVDLAELGVRQEKILRRNIPSGYPTDNKTITSEYGYRIHPIKNDKEFHSGVDLRAKLGANVYATADGIVRVSERNKPSGNYIAIRHNYGFDSYYAHLSKRKVKTGDIVHKGDLIGFAGNTGTRSTGPHLHYAIYYLRQHLNPISFLKWKSGSNEIFTQVRAIKWQSLISLINDQIIQQTLQLSLLGPALPEKSK